MKRVVLERKEKRGCDFVQKKVTKIKKRRKLKKN